MACFQHIDAVGGGDGDGATGAAFADDDRDRRHLEPQTRRDRAGDGLGLAAFLGIDAGEGAGGVDERDQRHLETVGKFHQAHRLAVALGPHGTEIVLEAARGVGTLFLAEDSDRFPAETGEAADHGLILAKGAVAG